MKDFKLFVETQRKLGSLVKYYDVSSSVWVSDCRVVRKTSNGCDLQCKTSNGGYRVKQIQRHRIVLMVGSIAVVNGVFVRVYEVDSRSDGCVVMYSDNSTQIVTKHDVEFVEMADVK